MICQRREGATSTTTYDKGCRAFRQIIKNRIGGRAKAGDVVRSRPSDKKVYKEGNRESRIIHFKGPRSLFEYLYSSRVSFLCQQRAKSPQKDTVTLPSLRSLEPGHRISLGTLLSRHRKRTWDTVMGICFWLLTYPVIRSEWILQIRWR